MGTESVVDSLATGRHGIILDDRPLTGNLPGLHPPDSENLGRPHGFKLLYGRVPNRCARARYRGIASILQFKGGQPHGNDVWVSLVPREEMRHVADHMRCN